MPTGFYLLDHKNRYGTGGFHGYDTRNAKVTGIVIHTNEINPPADPADDTAERLAKWASKTKSVVSWHAQVDSDSTIFMLPSSFTAFHARGYNSKTVGIEIATRAHLWGDNPLRDAKLLSNAAAIVAGYCVDLKIARKRITSEQLESGRTGLVAHADLDPGRRSDPGDKFPWDRFLELVEYHIDSDQMSREPKLGDEPAPKRKTATKPTKTEDGYYMIEIKRKTIQLGQLGELTKTAQGLMLARGANRSGLVDSSGRPDGVFGQGTVRSLKSLQVKLKLDPDGVIGPLTWAALEG